MSKKILPYISDHALNKDTTDAIVYRDAYGNLNFLTEKDFSSPEEFKQWKEWSDADYYEIENGVKPEEDKKDQSGVETDSASTIDEASDLMDAGQIDVGYEIEDSQESLTDYADGGFTADMVIAVDERLEIEGDKGSDTAPDIETKSENSIGTDDDSRADAKAVTTTKEKRPVNSTRGDRLYNDHKLPLFDHDCPMQSVEESIFALEDRINRELQEEAMLAAFVRRLTPIQARRFMLHFGEQKTIEEIAEAENVNVNAVWESICCIKKKISRYKCKLSMKYTVKNARFSVLSERGYSSYRGTLKTEYTVLRAQNLRDSGIRYDARMV